MYFRIKKIEIPAALTIPTVSSPLYPKYAQHELQHELQPELFPILLFIHDSFEQVHTKYSDKEP